jgi:hypothetical protein
MSCSRAPWNRGKVVRGRLPPQNLRGREDREVAQRQSMMVAGESLVRADILYKAQGGN